MSYINTTTPTRIWIGGREYTEFLINGSCNDESSLTNSICKTSGSIKLGGVHNSYIVREFPLPVGSEVIIQCSLPGGYSARHPRGTLYVINSTINYEEQVIDIEIGCSLYLVSVYENSFRTKIKSLFGFIPESYRAFDVVNFDLSELSSVLEALGYVMWQDKNGRIQCAKAFGGNGFGSLNSASKFTSFDNSTAISVQSLSESSTLIDPSELTISVDWDLPVYEEKDPEEEDPASDDAEEESGVPIDEVLEDRSIVKTRYLRLKPIADCLKTYEGTKVKIEEEKEYRCGKALSPEYIAFQEEKAAWATSSSPDICKQPLTEEEFFDTVSSVYSYSVSGKLETEEAYFADEIRRYQVAEYDGPGKQLNYEKTFEEMSLWRIAESTIGQWLSNVSKEYDLAIEEANQRAQEMNEYAQIRDDNNYNLFTNAKKACLTAKEKALMDRTMQFYDCLFASSNLKRVELIEYAREVYRIADWGLSFFYGLRDITNISERSVTFGKGGEILAKKEQNTIHAGASKFTQDLIRRAGEVFEKENEEGEVIDERETSRVGKYDFGPPLAVISGSPLETGFTVGNVFYEEWPDRFLKSETLNEYTYETNKTTERSTKTDYENPENNTVDIKVSTDNSLAPSAEPRNEEDAELDEEEDPNNLSACNIPTETKTVVYRIAGANTEETVGASWAGSFKPSPEEISMPIAFKPLVPKWMEPDQDMTDYSCNILTTSFITVAKRNMRLYERYINRYLSIAIAKRMMDNRGIRLVEKMRAEVFGYYPFMPITVVLASNNKVFLTRTSSATWAFDSTNAVCSFDCYVLTN